MIARFYVQLEEIANELRSFLLQQLITENDTPYDEKKAEMTGCATSEEADIRIMMWTENFPSTIDGVLNRLDSYSTEMSPIEIDVRPHTYC